MVQAELLFGAARKRGAVRLKTAIDEFLLRVDSLPWDSKAVRRYADLRALRLWRSPWEIWIYDDRGSRAGYRGRSGNERLFFSSIEAIENRGLDKVGLAPACLGAIHVFFPCVYPWCSCAARRLRRVKTGR